MTKLEKPKLPYKSKTGQWLTGALFLERIQIRPDWQKDYDPVFTLDHDRDGYISARKTFVALMDPTGYKWAMQYLQDWHHFLKLMEADWFKSRVEIWREEIQIKLEAEAINTIRAIAKNDEDKNQLTAAKFLHSISAKRAEPKRGRPSKAEVDNLLKAEASDQEQINSDAERIGLTVIKGGR